MIRTLTPDKGLLAASVTRPEIVDCARAAAIPARLSTRNSIHLLIWFILVCETDGCGCRHVRQAVRLPAACRGTSAWLKTIKLQQMIQERGTNNRKHDFGEIKHDRLLSNWGTSLRKPCIFLFVQTDGSLLYPVLSGPKPFLSRLEQWPLKRKKGLCTFKNKTDCPVFQKGYFSFLMCNRR